MSACVGLASVAVSLLLAGCSVAVGPTASPQTAAPGPAPPVEIHDELTLVQGAAREWSWPVGPEYSSFTATICVNGPGGTPQYTSSHTQILLEGPNVRRSTTDPGGVTPDAPGCLLEYEAGPGASPGIWRLNVTAEPSTATAVIDVVVQY